jgi:hypothetical protein
MEAAQLEGVHSGRSRSDCGQRQPTSNPTPANATVPPCEISAVSGSTLASRPVSTVVAKGREQQWVAARGHCKVSKPVGYEAAK